MSTMMWEAIAANKQRSALLIVSLATLLALMGLAIGFLLGGRPQSAYFGAFVGQLEQFASGEAGGTGN